MSNVETEDTEITEPEPLLTPVSDLDDLFADEDDEVQVPEIPENLSEDELRARLAKAEKQAAFEKDQRVKASRKNWAAEAKQHFPYSKPESIKADSRRAFLEAAKEQDADFRDRAAPILEKAEKTEEQLREEIRAELENEARGAWGRPTTQGGSGGTAAAESAEVDKRLETARRRKDLHGAAAALMDGRLI